LAQLAVVGNDHTGFAFFIGDLLTGDALVNACTDASEGRAARTEAPSANADLFRILPLGPEPRRALSP
jgi:hypothetical protein